MYKNKGLLDELKKILKEKGFKNTITRQAVLNVFLKNDEPISADYIYTKLKGKINEATVYRILSSFQKSRIIRRVDLRKDYILFELNDSHHHHIVCTNCGTIEDFRENKEVEKILEEIVIKSIKFKSINEHSLELFGFCKACS